MADQLDWGNEAKEQPKAKKRIPTWAWFCGGGCLLAIIAGIVFAVIGYTVVRKAADQDGQWASLATVLPYDAAPGDTLTISEATPAKLNQELHIDAEGNVEALDIGSQHVAGKTPAAIEAQLGSAYEASLDNVKLKVQVSRGNSVIVGMNWVPGFKNGWQIHRGEKLQVMILELDGDVAEQMVADFEGEDSPKMLNNFVGFSVGETTRGKVTIQGRELSFLRAATKSGADESEPTAESDEKPDSIGAVLKSAFTKSMVAIDLSPAPNGHTLVLAYIKVGTNAPVTDEELTEYLAPFHIGPQR